MQIDPNMPIDPIRMLTQYGIHLGEYYKKHPKTGADCWVLNVPFGLTQLEMGPIKNVVLPAKMSFDSVS